MDEITNENPKQRRQTVGMFLQINAKTKKRLLLLHLYHPHLMSPAQKYQNSTASTSGSQQHLSYTETLDLHGSSYFTV